jgi:hypothetical protein
MSCLALLCAFAAGPALANAAPQCVGPSFLSTCTDGDGTVRTIVKLRMSEVVQASGPEGRWHQVTHVLGGGTVIVQRGTTARGTDWWKSTTTFQWVDDRGAWHLRTDR